MKLIRTRVEHYRLRERMQRGACKATARRHQGHGDATVTHRRCDSLASPMRLACAADATVTHRAGAGSLFANLRFKERRGATAAEQTKSYIARLRGMREHRLLSTQ
jgi:hypothetical protein